jgi:hypothetical protein
VRATCSVIRDAQCSGARAEAAGLKETLIVQLEPAVKLLPQVVVSMKSVLSAPEIAMVLMVKAALPAF